MRRGTACALARGMSTTTTPTKTTMPTCRACGKKIRVPKGWTSGPAVRRHYWKEHRDVMLPVSSRTSSRT
jgi:hypothetical protein